jgi:hypothetical protein
MKQVGRLLIYIVGAVTLSITARGDIMPVTPNVNVMRQSMSLTNRMLLMKRHHMNLPKGFPQFSHPIPPQANVPQLRNATPTVGRAHAADVRPPTADGLSGNPYDSIVTRNMFGLNPIPPVVPQEAPSGPPPPKITLTGIMTIFGPPEALFKVAGVVRGNGRPQDESYIFTEGEEQDEVEVTRIDTNKDIVSFVNHGVAQEIPLASGVASSGSAPSSPSWPGQPGMRRPGRRFGGFNNPSNPGGFQPQSYSSPNGGGNGNNTAQNGSGVFNGNGQSSNYHNDSYVSPGISQLSDEDQQALVAAAHAQAAADPNSTVPPEMFPPTQFDKEAQNEAGGNTGGSQNPGSTSPR